MELIRYESELLCGQYTPPWWRYKYSLSCQSETVDKLTEKAQNLGVENATSGTRIESLENWSKKPSEKIDEGECHQTKQNFRERETYKKVFVRLIVSLKVKTAAEKKDRL